MRMLTCRTDHEQCQLEYGQDYWAHSRQKGRTGSVMFTAFSMTTTPLFSQTLSIMSMVIRTASSHTSLLFGYEEKII